MSPHWYCCRTKPDAEATAEEHLQQQGFETYLPVYRKPQRVAKPRKQQRARIDAKPRKQQRARIDAKPLFKRYLFVAFDMETQQWWKINNTIGVHNLVGDNIPTPVRDSVIAELQAPSERRRLHRTGSAAAASSSR